MRWWVLGVVLMACAAHPAEVARSRGSAIHPGFRLPHGFEPRAYRARIALEEHAFIGHVEIDGDLTAPMLWLNAEGLEITGAVAVHDSISVPLTIERWPTDQVIGLAGSDPLAPGRWTIALSYRGPIRDAEPAPPRGVDAYHSAHGLFRRVVDGRTYFFTQSEAIAAREIFPCIDEPDRKVPWQLTLDVPAGDVALGNALLVRESPLDSGHHRFELAPTLPLPSYLIAFAVGPFDVVDAGETRHRVPIRIALPHGQATTAAGLDAIVRAKVAMLEDYLTIPFPYPKLDVVAVPDLGLGAMENAGLITIDAALFADRAEWTNVVTHELVHHWFGDLVTIAWWDDIWLAESFAVWLPALIAGRDLVIANHDALAHYARPFHKWFDARLLRTWQVDYTHPIVSLLESYVGAEGFRHGLQTYLRDHAHRTARADDLFAALDGATAAHLSPQLERLADDRAPPRVAMEWECQADHASVAIARTRHRPEALWSLPVCFAYGDAGSRSERCVASDSALVTVELDRCPTWLLPVRDGVALYRSSLTTLQQAALVGDGWAHLTPEEQRYVVLHLEDTALELGMLPRLLGDAHGRALVARVLLMRRGLVPHDLRSALDAWILKTLGGQARSLADDDPLAELLAIAGDASLVAQARALADPLPARNVNAASLRGLRILAIRDPVVAARLIADAAITTPIRDLVLAALYDSPWTVDLLAAHPADLASFSEVELKAILSRSCDASNHAAVARLTAALSPEHQAGVEQACTANIAEMRNAKPALRALLVH